MKIVGIVGSLRKDSYNKVLINKFAELLPADIDFKITSIGKLPLFNEDIEFNKIDAVESFRKDLNEADIIIISSPEYNYSIPGVLKNALDWASRGEELPFVNKKVAIMSSSNGRFGGIRMQAHLRQVLLSLNANVLNRPEVIINNIDDKVDNLNHITDERTIRSLQRLIDTIIK